MAVIIDPLKIDGLRDLQAGAKAFDGESQKQIRVILNEAAELVVAGARPLIPRQSGRLVSSLKAASGQREASVKLGGARVPYAGWIEFGGRVGRSQAITRPFIRAGRSVYPTVRRREAELGRVMEDGLERLAESVGL